MSLDLEARFATVQPAIGMVHLPALPGAPNYDRSADSLDEIIDTAQRDAQALEAGGVDGIMVENFGDVPFYPDSVPKHVVASLTRATRAVVETVNVPVGVNVLRNDGPAALSVAAAAGGSFIRVNVHTGARVSDQGILEGAAHETLRLRDRIGAEIAIFADHDVKHSAPLAAESFAAESMADGVERGLADATVVTGTMTGSAADLEDLQQAVERRDTHGLDVPIFVGSGVTADNVGAIMEHADGVIVGTSLKQGGEVRNPVSEDRVRELVTAAGGTAREG